MGCACMRDEKKSGFVLLLKTNFWCVFQRFKANVDKIIKNLKNKNKKSEQNKDKHSLNQIQVIFTSFEISHLNVSTNQQSGTPS